MTFHQRARTGYDTADLRAFVQSGATLGDIAAETGSSKKAVRQALRWRGLRATREGHQRLRARVQAMRQSDAVEYLLACLELLAGPLCADHAHPVDGWGIHLTRGERRVMICLHDAAGGVRPAETLLDALTFDLTGDHPTRRVVRDYVWRIRRKLPSAIGRIETVQGQGYRFHRAPA